MKVNRCISEGGDWGWADLITHVRFLSAVGLHVLGESFLHRVDPMTNRARELGDFWQLMREDGKRLLNTAGQHYAHLCCRGNSKQKPSMKNKS